MTKTVLRTGDRDMVTFKFIKNPEYLSVGSRMVFREGRTKAVGTIAKVYPYTPALPKQVRPKHMKYKGKLFIFFMKSSAEFFSFAQDNDLCNCSRRCK